MWNCPACGQTFAHNNQQRSCGDKTLEEFFKGKSEYTVSLFQHFIDSYQRIGKISIHPTKSMIALAATKRMAYITQLGKNFIDVTFPFDKSHTDNLCFRKIAQVPGSNQYNHHFRMMSKEDVNAEVKKFMKLAYNFAK